MHLPRSVSCGLLALVFSVGIIAQSSSPEFPTPVVSSELSGSIRARDIGDSRVTTYYYAFNGEQGDIFINLVSKNFTGDIDVFAANGLRPMTKIVVYADRGESETGRVIYLRKPERLLLRIQGRTPNDDEATFRLKFAGSFLALRPDDVPAAPELPKVTLTADNRVNSVGTIIPRPERSPQPSTELAQTAAEPSKNSANAEMIAAKESEKSTVGAGSASPEKGTTAVPRSNSSVTRRRSSQRTKPEPAAKEVVVDSQAVDKAVSDNEPVAVENLPKAEAKTETAAKSENTGSSSRSRANSRSRSKKPAEESKPDPLASINLVVQFKNGDSLERKMSEVFKFSVDKGVLTVILKDGAVTRYPIVDVAKVTIE